jgi:outer membrane lipoprotein-sorting protein
MTVFDRRPRLRWLVPGATVALIAAGALVGTSTVTADPGLEPKTAAELLTAVQQSETSALSGTVEMTADLGLPALPAGMGGADTGPLSLISGTNTVRVWADGPDRSRVAVIGDAQEYTVVRDGETVWTWSSADSTATRYTIDTADRPKVDVPASMDLPSTPQEAADLVLSSIDPTTQVTVAGVASVAGRPVYELILTPRDGDTRVARVALAIDAETMTPLRVQVFSTQIAESAIEVGFTSVDFSRPDPSLFAFTPPAGATVVEREPGEKPEGAMAGAKDDRPEPTVVGSGWSQVLVADLPTDAAADSGSGDLAQAEALLSTLPETSGPWGTGRVIDGTLVSAILTDDGRVAIGAVGPQALAAALAAE